ncbi:hypothetical protein ACI2LF_43675 [Kribbella sp. NPDC020789]
MSEKNTADDTSRNRRGGIGKISGTVGRRIENPKGPIHVGTGKLITGKKS